MKNWKQSMFNIIREETIQDLREELVHQPQQDYICPGSREFREEQVQELVLNSQVLQVSL